MANTLAYFSGEGLVFPQGPQLWVTDGTVQGTHEVLSPNLLDAGTGLAQFGSRLLFAGVDTQGKFNLFISNGTGAGTDELRTANAGQYGLFTYTFTDFRHGGQQINDLQPSFAVLGSTAVFTGVDAADHFQLWSTDGTTPGTREITTSAVNASGLDPNAVTAIGNVALFSGLGSGDSTYEGLWVTDGTSTGTRELRPGNEVGDPSYITALNGKALFNAVDATGRSELFVSDGTGQGTTELNVADASTGSAGLNPSYITAFGNAALFSGVDANGRNSLWVTDGSGAGTHEILPASADSAGLFDTYAEPDFTKFGSDVLFPARAADGSEQLWITDGTQAGTRQLTTSAEGSLSDFGEPPEIAMIGDKAVFGDFDDIHGKFELWVTDGTASGTDELMPPGTDPYGLFPEGLTNLGTVVVFSGADVNENRQLWVTDGTTAGTQEIIPSGLGARALNPDGFLAISPSAAPIVGGAFGPSLIEGTPGDDTIIASGADNTIRGDGGSDTITTGSGGYTTISEGTLNDGAVGSTTITLAGRGNAVTGGDEDFTITGGTGFTGVTLGNGNNAVTLGGTYNTVTVGLGTNVVDAGGGYSKVFVSGFDRGAEGDDTITFHGDHDQLSIRGGAGKYGAFGTATVSGGTGYGKFDLGQFGGSVTTDGLYNVVSMSAGDATITPGSGADQVDFADSFYGVGDVTVHLAGSRNVVEGVASKLTSTGGDGSNRFNLNQEDGYGAGVPGPFPGDEYTVTTDGLYNSFLLLSTNNNTITTGSGGAQVSITNPVLLDPGAPFTFTPLTSTINFAGTNNALTAVDGPVTASGGAGNSTYVLGAGNDSVTTSGDNNRITLGAGTDTVSVDGNKSTITLNGSNANLVLHGSGDVVFLNAGASGTIGGNGGSGLRIHVAPGIGVETIANIASDPMSVFYLSGGAGGYTTQAQIGAALAPDGSGGTRLAIGTGAIDFLGVAPSDLHAGMFAIG